MIHSAHPSRMLFLACTLAVSACSGSGDGTQRGSVDAGQDAAVEEAEAPLTCDHVVSDDDCDDSLPPIVFVHGTFGSGDQFANAAQLFGSNGYCQDRIVAVEYDSVTLNALGSSGSSDPITKQIDALIDDILKKTGQKQVELAGHSQGTLHCVNYLSDAKHAAKVAHYINISGTTQVPNGVPTLSISSENDLGGKPNHAPNAEKKVTFKDEDHVDCASSNKSFIEIYKYLMGKAPKYTEVQCGDEQVTLEGIAETFGDNEPITTGQLEVYELGSSPRDRGKPVKTIKAGTDGRAAPFKLKRGIQYEFKAVDGQGNLIGHAYLGPYKRSDRLARFLAPSTNPLVAGLSTSQMKLGPGYSALIARNIRGSFRHDTGLSLIINGKEVLTNDNAGRSMVTVGLFMMDQNQNGKSDLGNVFPTPAPFLVGTDVFMAAKEPAWTHIVWNGQKLRVPNWPSVQNNTNNFIYILLP